MANETLNIIDAAKQARDDKKLTPEGFLTILQAVQQRSEDVLSQTESSYPDTANSYEALALLEIIIDLETYAGVPNNFYMHKVALPHDL
ncbi:MAG TPA: hypothetical protein VLH19_02345 [Patescibacteria group bacterium]|nr:hypothetical protein [Patescibacteria group bacterium]